MAGRARRAGGARSVRSDVDAGRHAAPGAGAHRAAGYVGTGYRPAVHSGRGGDHGVAVADGERAGLARQASYSRTGQHSRTGDPTCWYPTADPDPAGTVGIAPTACTAARTGPGAERGR